MKRPRLPVRRAVKVVTIDALHAWTHILLGITWLYCVGFFIPHAMTKYIGITIIGTLLPDIEHFFYIFLLRRNAPYSKTFKSFIRQKQMRNLVTFVKENHKSKIFLPLHHMLMPVIVAIVAFVAYVGQQEGTLIFFGAVATHYIYDMFDDLLYLGRLNPNWTRGIPRFWRR